MQEQALIEETVDVKELIEKIDILTDIKKPQKFPWPYEEESVKELVCNGVLEFIPGKLRGKFMDEIYRILVTGGKAAFAVPYWNSSMALHDYRYEWPTLTEQSFLMFNKGWREANKKDVDILCDFDFTYGYTAEPSTAARNEESRSFFIKHYSNTVEALHLILTKR